ncbi:MAG: J domain-containing protein, partial [Thermomicrobiales bacterium]
GTHYETLGVPIDATPAQVARAYRAAMKRFHPDRQGEGRRASAEEQAKRINEAYATLSKPFARQAYDRTIQQQVVQDQIMSRYVGGFATGPAAGSDPLGGKFRRDPTAAERRDRQEANRGALVSLVLVFAGVTVGLVALLVAWAALVALAGRLF